MLVVQFSRLSDIITRRTKKKLGKLTLIKFSRKSTKLCKQRKKQTNFSKSADVPKVTEDKQKKKKKEQSAIKKKLNFFQVYMTKTTKKSSGHEILDFFMCRYLIVLSSRHCLFFDFWFGVFLI